MLRVYLDTTSRLTAAGKRKHWKTNELVDCVITKAQPECKRVLTSQSVLSFFQKCKQEYDVYANSLRSGSGGGEELLERTPWHASLFEEYASSRPSIIPTVLVQSGCKDQESSARLQSLQVEEQKLRELQQRYSACMLIELHCH